MNDLLKIANSYGMPIPLILIAVTLYFLRVPSFNWSNRKKYYDFLLNNLGIWRDGLSDMLDYYQHPDSVYEPIPETEHFKGLQEKSHIALQKIKESIPEARLYLSKKSGKILDNLIAEHWYISVHGTVHMQEYLFSTHKVVDDCYNELLKHAKRDLWRKKYAAPSKIIANNKSS